MSLSFDVNAFVGGGEIGPYIIDMLFLQQSTTPTQKVIKNDNVIVSVFDQNTFYINSRWAIVKDDYVIVSSFNADGTESAVDVYTGDKYNYTYQSTLPSAGDSIRGGDLRNDKALIVIGAGNGFKIYNRASTSPVAYELTYTIEIPNENSSCRFSPSSGKIALILFFSTFNYLAIGTVTSTSWSQDVLYDLGGDPGFRPRSIEWITNTYLAYLPRVGQLQIFKYNGSSAITPIYTTSGTEQETQESMSIGINNESGTTYYIACGRTFYKFNSSTESTTDLSDNIDVLPPAITYGAKWVGNRLFVPCGTDGIYVYDRVGDNLIMNAIIPSTGGNGIRGLANFQEV
jgi:hypothetical protein